MLTYETHQGPPTASLSNSDQTLGLQPNPNATVYEMTPDGKKVVAVCRNIVVAEKLEQVLNAEIENGD